MNHSIQLTAEQFEALQSGQPITIEPPKPTTTKWEPKPGIFTLRLAFGTSVISYSDDSYRLAGMEYQTQSQADSAAKQLRAYARQLAWLAENDDGWVADWSDNNQNKYCVYFVHSNSRFKSYSLCCNQYINTISMSKSNAEKLAQLMNDGIVEF